MHDLTPTSALSAPREQIGSITIAENTDFAVASVAARRGHEIGCQDKLRDLLGDLPGPGRSQLADPLTGFWIGPDQWMMTASFASHEDLTNQMKDLLGMTASVTEQTGAWVVLDVRGVALPEMLERLCPLPIRTMVTGDARRTTIHQLGCFVIVCETLDHVRLLVPRASVASLHHALVSAARSAA